VDRRVPYKAGTVWISGATVGFAARIIVCKESKCYVFSSTSIHQDETFDENAEECMIVT
jgi:hypothetical protein